MFSLTARTTARTVAAAPNRLGALRSVGGLGSNMHDNDPETIESEKQKNLSGKQESTIKNAPGWNDRLASASEASVKADRADVDPSTLQAETVSAIKKRHHSGDTVVAHEETKTTINTNGSTTVETVADVIKS